MFVELISRFGYAAVFVLAAVEGDGTLLAASFLAHRGYLRLWMVIEVAIAATVLANQGYYWLGRRYGAHLAQGRLGKHYDRVQRLMERVGPSAIVASRFLYGFKTVIPMFSGASAVAPLRFALLDGAGAVVWGFVVGLAGMGIAHLLAQLVVELHRYEWLAAGILLLSGFLLLGWRRVRSASA